MSLLRITTSIVLLLLVHSVSGQPRPGTELAVAGSQRIQAFDLLSESAETSRISFATSLPPEELASTAPREAQGIQIDRRLLTANQFGEIRQLMNSEEPVEFDNSYLDSSYVTLPLRDGDLSLGVIESVLDERYGLRHVTAALAEYPSGYARFTVDDATGLVVGTLSTPRGQFRIFPTSRDQIDLVVSESALRRFSDGIDEYIAREFHGPRAREVLEMERRHQQVEALATIQPDFFQIARNGATVILMGGALGSIDPNRLSDANEIRNLLTSLNSLTNAAGEEDYRVVSIRERVGHDGTEFVVAFRQVLDGLPIRREQDIVVDSIGKVKTVRSSVVSSTTLPRSLRRSLGRDAALQHALAELRVEFGTLSRVQNHVELEEMAIDVSADLDDPGQRRLIPVWHSGISFESADGPHAVWVTVHLDSGEVKFESATENAFRHNVYRTVSGSPTAPGSETAVVFTEVGTSNTFSCSDGCGTTAYVRPTNIIARAEVLFEGAAPANCCNQIGNNIGSDQTINVIVGSAGNNSSAGEWIGISDSIVLETSAALSVDSIMHEFGHAYLSSYAQAMFTPPGQENASAFREGFSDSIAAAFAALASQEGFLAQNENVGDHWVMWDGDNLNPTRNLKDPSIQMSRLSDSTLSEHERGRAVGNFFYRLSQAGGITPQRLMQLVLATADTLADLDQNGIDASDFKAALDQQSLPEETALQAAIDSVWAHMNGSGGSGGSGSGGQGGSGSGSGSGSQTGPPTPDLVLTMLECYPHPMYVSVGHFRLSFYSVPGAHYYQMTGPEGGLNVAGGQSQYIFETYWPYGSPAAVSVAACDIDENCSAPDVEWMAPPSCGGGVYP